MPSNGNEEQVMPYAVLEKEIKQLDETQQNAVVMFVRFLLSQKSKSGSVSAQKSAADDGRCRWEAFDRIREKAAIDHKDHEWTMDEIDAEIAASRRERRLAGATA